MKWITVGARQSPLSQAQVNELKMELWETHSGVDLEVVSVETTGDKDLKTSLRGVDKTDFFTRELDAMVLKGECRIAVHSAKDLPEPLPKGLSVIAITEGIDPSDALVMREGEGIDTLSSGAVIATSSGRREDAVRELRSDVTFVDLRGTIHQRLELLEKGEADGVVVAEAALIRLGLTHLNRVQLPGETAPYQGRLAVVGQEDDEEMEELFACLDAR